MIVIEYNRVFYDMSRFTPEQVDTDEKMPKKFCAGLRHKIKIALASHGKMSYTITVSKALNIEAAMPGDRPTSTPVPTLVHFLPQDDIGNEKGESNQGHQSEKKPGQGQPPP